MGWIDVEQILRHNLKEDILSDTGEADENIDADQRHEMWKKYQDVAKKKKVNK